MVRRTFIKTAGLSAGAFWVRRPTHAAQSSGAGLPALLGGEKAYRGKWPTWPRWIPEHDEPGFLKCLRSGVWSRAATVTEFEKRWAEAVGAKRCLAVVNGTNALITALAQLGIGAGDEVILPPYTFIATAQAILMNGAIPVFCDIDPATYQIAPRRIESKITSRTRAILPVHILGLPADMAAITALAKKHGLYVVEDACQAWLAEVNGKKCGTLGNAGCYSFQNSKNLAIGEGGAIVSDDDAFMDRCHAYHNYGNAYGTAVGVVGAGTAMLGTSCATPSIRRRWGWRNSSACRRRPRCVMRTRSILKHGSARFPGSSPTASRRDACRLPPLPVQVRQRGVRRRTHAFDLLEGARRRRRPLFIGLYAAE